MRNLRWLSFAILTWLFLAGVIIVSAQPIPKEDYITYLPLTYLRIKIQTAASRDLHLFGDVGGPSYRDENPVDGIDDRRGETLEKIAARFAPYMIQNTSNIPMDFKLFMRDKKNFPLFIDTWDLSPRRGRNSSGNSPSIWLKSASPARPKTWPLMSRARTPSRRSTRTIACCYL